jgi:PIN domain nuclease of toxin-antitoxin system
LKSLLLDTHVLLWALSDPGRLAPAVRKEIESPDSNVFVSAASGWEIEIKRSLGKLEAPDDLEEQLRLKRFTELPVHLRHVTVLARLPALHRDPFDRMLAAQCLCDDLVMVTHDEQLLAYPVKSLRAT